MTPAIEIRLKEEVIQEIRQNKTLKNQLQLGLNIGPATLARHLANNDEKLTTATALKIIRDGLNKTNDELLNESDNA